MFGGIDVCFDGAHRVVGHQFHSDGGRQVKNHVHAVYGFCEGQRVGDGCISKVQSRVVADCSKIRGTACGQVVKNDHGVPLEQQQFGEMTADEA